MSGAQGPWGTYRVEPVSNGRVRVIYTGGTQTQPMDAESARLLAQSWSLEDWTHYARGGSAPESRSELS